MTGRGPELPSELREFLFTCVDSVEQLEILLRMHANAKAWTVKEMSAAKEMAEPVTRAHLEALVARGLLRVQSSAVPDTASTYIYEPKSSDLARYVELLAHHYQVTKSSVVSFVSLHSHGGLRRFSDAFKLRDPES
jgi:hypothetical protein